MLTPGGPPRPRLIIGLIALVGAMSLPLAVAGPASADQARQRQQWVLSALHVSTAWHVTQGQGVTVAVIDSGVDPKVSDLTGSVTSGPDYTGVHTPRSNPNWGAHGTWMASLIAGHGHGHGNKDGILGVAPKAKIMSIRVITDRSDPGYHAYETEPAWRGQRELAKAITYAVRHGADVINMSLGYDGASRAVRSALQGALMHNVVVVASSGNAGASHAAGHGSAPYSFPADYPGVIGVAAVTESGAPASFSSENLSVQVAAPGVNVPAQGRGSKYWVVSGTSPASALTAGVAALIKSRFPKLTAAQVRSAITGTTADRPHGGYDPNVGFGTVNAAAALRMAGRLSKQTPAGQTQAGQTATSGNFGGGETGVPAFPVAPLGHQKLLVFGGIAAGAVLFLVIAVWLLARSRRQRRAAKKRGPIGVTATQGGVGGAGTVWPMSQPRPGHPAGMAAAGIPPAPFAPAGAAGGAMDVRYPTQIYPAQPPGLPVQGYISQPGQFGQPGQAPQAAEAERAGFSPQGYAVPGHTAPGYSAAGTEYAGQWGAQGNATPTFTPAPQQGGGGSGPGDAGPAGPPAPADGVSSPAPALPASAGQGADADSDWPFEDGPSAPDDSPAATAPTTAATVTPAGADQTAQPAQGDPQPAQGPHPAARPGRTILPKPDSGSPADDDPLTSPRYARDGRAERALRTQRPNWLSGEQGVTKPMASPGHEAAQSAPVGTERLPRRSRQQGQAEPESQPVQPSPSIAAGSAETAPAQSIPALQDQPAGPPLTQPGGAQSAEPATRSVFEPYSRSRPGPADPAPGETGHYVGPSIKTGPSAWQASQPRQPSSWQHGDATASGPEAATAAAAAETISGVGPGETLYSSRSKPEASPSSEPGTRDKAQAGLGAARLRPEAQQGSDGLPKRQPMSHLAAPLRRNWPSSDTDERPSSGPQPSVWDTWRPTASVRRAAQEDGSDSGDGQA